MGRVSGHLWVDATAGVAGDMVLAALLDAGADLEAVRTAVAAVIPGEVAITVEQVDRAGLAASHVRVEPTTASPDHRAWAEIEELLRGAALPGPVRETALAVFGALARAEAAAHGVEEGAVHFHEVGAWDSVADVVGAAAALHDLGVGEVTTTPVGLGSGTVQTQHGRMPVPVPAVLELLAAGSVEAAAGEGLVGECATPTGVALLTALARRTATSPAGAVRTVGVGAGTRDTPGRANLVRVVLHEPRPDGGHRPTSLTGGSGDGSREEPVTEPSTEPVTERVEDLVEVAATVDDLDPRVWPTVVEACLEAGALDAWLVPVQMKKGRPGTVVHVLVRPDDQDAVVDLLLAQTPTLGVRWHHVFRRALGRLWREVGVEGGSVRVKLGVREGQILTATPELEDCRALAAATGRPLRVVLREAEAAAWSAGWRPAARAPGSGAEAQGPGSDTAAQPPGSGTGEAI